MEALVKSSKFQASHFDDESSWYSWVGYHMTWFVGDWSWSFNRGFGYLTTWRWPGVSLSYLLLNFLGFSPYSFPTRVGGYAQGFKRSGPWRWFKNCVQKGSLYINKKCFFRKQGDCFHLIIIIKRSPYSEKIASKFVSDWVEWD